MFRKRHVQIGPAGLTMARNDALSFYGKDRHVHGYWSPASRRRWVTDHVSRTRLKSGVCGD